jgi:hypothetical protein
VGVWIGTGKDVALLDVCGYGSQATKTNIAERTSTRITRTVTTETLCILLNYQLEITPSNI